ncbi:hypothetical protein F4802DRAFT_349426 [Xylaria palmicola]|nr:hypothetical protein F4802DRAFT_349426 [Xylaria palmicola]
MHRKRQVGRRTPIVAMFETKPFKIGESPKSQQSRVKRRNDTIRVSGVHNIWCFVGGYWSSLYTFFLELVSRCRCIRRRECQDTRPRYHCAYSCRDVFRLPSWVVPIFSIHHFLVSISLVILNLMYYRGQSHD